MQRACIRAGHRKSLSVFERNLELQHVTILQVWRSHGVSVANRIARIAISLGVVAGVVTACMWLRHVHLATTVLALLLAILMIGRRWEFLEAVAATLLSAALLAYFFLPPNGWGIDSGEHWLVFFTFLIVALVASHFAAKAKRQTLAERIRRNELEKLYTFGRELAIGGSSGSIVGGSVNSLARTFQVEAAAFYDSATGKVTRAGPSPGTISDERLREAVGCTDNSIAETATEPMFVAVRCGGKVVGSLAVFDRRMSTLTFRAIVGRIEAGLEKVDTHERLRHAEDVRRSQELKSALLDSLAHEIKTPLSVIKTAASSLLSRDSDAANRSELLSIINEEADRLEAAISEVFWAARVEARALESGKGPHDIGKLVGESLDELKPLLAGRSVTVAVPDSLPPANCDHHMIKGVLKELLNNALKYSPGGSPLAIGVEHLGDQIVTSVTDFGIDVAPGEEKRIFERHYRGNVRVPGTGLGLAIAKTIVEAHGGRIGVTRPTSGGTVFHFSLPVSQRKAA